MNRVNDVCDLLEAMERELAFRIAGLTQGREAAPYSPFRETEHRARIDEACEALVLGAAQEYRSGVYTAGLPRISSHLLEPVRWRMRDARRYLSEAGAKALLREESLTEVLRKLLVHSWQVYSAPYWGERLSYFRSHQAPGYHPVLSEEAS